MKKTFLAKTALTLIAALFGLTGARAETSVRLTVYDGNVTNTHVPVYGAQVGDAYIRSQFIIPQGQLSGMVGGKITSLIFYAQQEVVNWYSEAKFDVYLGQVSNTQFSRNNASYVNWNNLTKVYSGNLAINGNQLIITLNTPFSYSGGQNSNLLIGFKQTATNSNGACTFLGQQVSRAAAYSTSYGANDDGTLTTQSFIPKTTFVFTPGYTPTNLTVSNITYQDADVTWQGNADSYTVRYRTNRVGFSENFDSGIPSTWTVWKKGEAPDDYPNGWGPRSGKATSYSWYDGVSYRADNWLISPAVDLGGTLKFDAAVTAWHDIYEVKLCTADIAPADLTVADFDKTLRELTPGITGTEDIDLSAYNRQRGYIAFHHTNYDGHYLNIDNFSVSSGHAWKEITTTGNSAHLTGLLRGSDYEIIVIATKQGVEGGAKSDTKIFTTPDSNLPVILANDVDNEDMIYDYNGRTYNVQLTGRTFKKNGNWNTLCLPFDVTLANSPLAGAEVRTMSSTTSITGEKLTLKTESVSSTKLEAGTPYLIRWTDGGDNIEDPLFSTATFDREMHDVTVSGLEGGKSVVFKGNYRILTFSEVDKSILFINSNKVYYVGNGSYIYPQRAYFKIEGLGGGSVKQMVLDWSEDDPTGINNLDANDNEAIYNLAGMRIGKMQKGINIVNGKKIIVK